MPTYTFRCNVCTQTEDMIRSMDSRDDPVFHCDEPAVRILAFNIAPTFTEHFNSATGTYVSSKTELNDAFKRSSEAASAYTGLYHNFVAVDPMDRAAVGITDEQAEQGQESVAKKIEAKLISPTGLPMRNGKVIKTPNVKMGSM